MPVSTKDLWTQSRAEAPQESEAVQPLAPGSHPTDPGYEVPVTSVPLPSKGLVYPPESPLYLCEHIDIRAMTARDEDILSSVALIKKGTVLSTLMRSCITNRTIDPDQMLVGDRNAVLIAIRVSAYGAEYPANVTCAECGESFDHTFDMSRLPVNSLSVEPLGGPGTNAFEFTLPASKRRVAFKLMDVGSSQRLEKDAEGVRKNGGQEAGVTLRLRAQVLQIEGVDPKDMVRTIQNMPARDSRALRKYMDDIAPGIDMVQEVECPTCGASKEVDVPLGPQFFWPSGA